MSLTAVVDVVPSSGLDDNAAVTTTAAIAARAARGTVAALVAQAMTAALYVIASLVLARLLSPDDFGVFALAFAVVAVVNIVQHGGLLLPLVQTRTLSRSQLASVFWFCAAVGVGQAGLGGILAPIVAWLFRDPRLTAPIVVLALGYVATGLTTTETALMRRRMEFGRLAMMEVTTVCIAVAVAIGAAWLGAGYWSLVLLQVARQFAFCAVLLIATGGVPRPRLHIADLAPLLQTGRVMVVFEAVAFLNTRVDNLIVGWFAGPATLGFYAKAYEFVVLISNQIYGPIGSVVHATLSRVQDDARRFEMSVRRGVLLTTSIAAPFFICLAAHAPLVVAVLFGEKWLPSAPLVRALAPGAMTMAITASVGWIFASLGTAQRQLPWAVMSSIATVTAFAAATPWGALGIALAFSGCRVLLLVPSLIFTCQSTPVAWHALLGVAARPVAASALAALVSRTTAASLVAAENFPSFCLVMSVFAACYVAAWTLLHGGPRYVREQLAFAASVWRHE